MIETLVLLAMTVSVTQPDKPLRVLDKGDQSSMDSSRQSAARTAAEYEALWRLHAPDRPLPKVDFSREMVVGVFLGSRPTAGFTVDVVGAREEEDALVVRYRETRPEQGVLTAQVITYPYAIVALPRRDGAVRFEKVE